MTNKVYAANANAGTVSVIDGATNNTTTVTVGSNPEAVALNPVTNQVYVANENSNTVTVIDGAPTGGVSHTSLTASANPAAPGSPVTFTASIWTSLPSARPNGTAVLLDYAAPLAPIVAGTVFYPDGAVQIGGAPCGNGSVTFTTSALAGGLHPLFAVYSGDAKWHSSSSSLLEGINLSPYFHHCR